MNIDWGLILILAILVFTAAATWRLGYEHGYTDGWLAKRKQEAQDG